MMVHAAAASMLQTPELELDKPEAHNLAEASASVLRHYPGVEVPAQVIDWIGLISVVGMVYGPRMVAIRLNRKTARQAAPPSLNDIRAATDNVGVIRPINQNGSAAPSRSNGGPVTTDIPGLPGVRILRPSGTQ